MGLPLTIDTLLINIGLMSYIEVESFDLLEIIVIRWESR